MKRTSRRAWRSASLAAALAFMPFIASPAAAQAGRDGCYFGECPGGRPAAATPQAVPVEGPRPPSAPPRPQKQATAPASDDPSRKATPMPLPSSTNAPTASAPPSAPKPAPPPPAAAPAPAPKPAPKPEVASAPRKPSGPKVGGKFCSEITEIADLATEEFKSIADKRLSKSTIGVKRSLPGADVCAISARDGEKTYLCFWEVETRNMSKVVASFVETVSNCFEGAESEDLGEMSHRISATDDADILVVGDTDKKRVILVISQAEEEEEETPK